MYAIILALLMALPGVATPLDGETVESHRARLGTVAQSILSAANQATCSDEWAGYVECQRIWPGTRNELVLSLVTVGFHESRFIGRIQAGKCRKDECDSYKDASGRIQHRSRSYFQIQDTGAVSADEWREMVGSESWPTFVASSVAARVLSTARTACARGGGSWQAGTFSRYGTGSSCTWRRVGSRVSTYAKASQIFSSLDRKSATEYSLNDGTPIFELAIPHDHADAHPRSGARRPRQTGSAVVGRDGNVRVHGLPGLDRARGSRQGARQHRSDHGVAKATGANAASARTSSARLE